MILFGGSSSNYFLGNDSGVGGNGSGINYFFNSGSINYFYRIGCGFFGGLRALAGAGGESNGGYDSSCCDERLFHDFIKY